MSEPGGGTGSTVRGVYHLFVGNFTSSLLLGLVAIVVGRLLGPSGYGLYAIALVVPGYVFDITQAGTSWAATRFGAKYSGEGDSKKAVSFIHSMVVLQFLFSVLGFLVASLFSVVLAVDVLNRPALSAMIPIATLAVVGQGLLTTVSGGLQGMQRMDRSAYLQVLQAAVKVVVSIALIVAGYSVLGAVVGNSVAYLIPGVLGFGLIISMNGRIFPEGYLDDVRVGLLYAAPLYVGALIGNLVSPYQSTLLARFVSNGQIGGYSAAVNISALVSLFVFPITTALFPLFSRYGRDIEKLKEVYAKTTRYATVIVTPVTMVIMALASPLTAAIYGRAYHFAGLFLVGAIAWNLATCFGGLTWGALLGGAGETKESFYSTAAGSVVSFAASPLLIIFFGVMGAIAAAVLGQATSLVLAELFTRRHLGLSLGMQFPWRIYASSAVAALVAYLCSLVPVHPILVTLLGGVVFLAVLIPMMVLLKAMTREDVTTFEGYFVKIKLFYYPFEILVAYYDLFDRSQDGS